MPLETEGGDLICTTRSMAPMSMPSSSEDVATRPRRVPILRRSSISLRWSAATLPWCARTRVSPASSLTAPEMRSARRRLLTKMSVEVWARTSSRSLGWMALQMEGRMGAGDGGFEFGEDLLAGIGGALFFGGGSGNGAAQEAGDFVERSLRSGESDALELAPAKRFQALQGEGEVTAALGGHEGVDFIQHDGFDGAQRFARVGGEQEVDGFRGGDQDIGGVAGEAGAFGGGGVAGADGDGGVVESDAPGAGGPGDAGEGGAQVAFDIDGKRLDGRDVEDAAALVARRHGGEHEAVDAPQECGEGFAGTGGGEDEGGVAAGDGGPAA